MRGASATRELARALGGVRLQQLQSPTYLSAVDSNGNERVRIGEQDDGSFGIRIWDDQGSLRLDETW